MKINRPIPTLFLSFLLFSCSSKSDQIYFVEALKNKSEFHSDGFVFPVGTNNTEGYYNAQEFGENNHLGEDWNGKGGGNTDIGDPIYACANGYVIQAKDLEGGWGNVIRIVHYLPNHDQFQFIESIYAHCDEIQIEKGDFVKRGQQIGTIGTGNGKYLAHLHFELRHVVGWSLFWGYQENTFGFLNPTEFILKNRPE